MIIIIFLLLFPSLVYSQKEYDYYMDSLSVVYGVKNFEGKSDCNAKCSLTSDGNSIIIRVEVKDDSLIFNNSIYSDHIELWFGYPDMFQFGFDYGKEGNKYSYIIGSDKYLYQYQNKPYLKSVIEEMKNPFIKDGDYYGNSKNYNHLDGVDERWLKEEIDNFLSSARKDSLYKTYVFFGITHFGINPKNGLITFYDQENYNYFKKYLNAEIGELNNFIKVQTMVGKNQYTANIIVNPEALAFVNISGIIQQKFLIDIVDCDSDGEQSSILSTSHNRKWGDVDTFSEVRFKKNIDVNINQEFPFLGKERHQNTSEFENKLRQICYDTYFYTDQGWKGIQGITSDFEVFSHPSLYTLPNLQRYYFEINDLSSTKFKIGNRDITGYTFGSKNFISIDNEKLYDKSNILKLFQLSNGEIALIVCERAWGGGRYQRWDESKLWFEKEKGKRLLIGQSVGGFFVLNDTIKVENWEMDNSAMAYEDFSWENILQFNLSKNSMVMTIGDNEIEVSWNNDGTSLKYEIIK